MEKKIIKKFGNRLRVRVCGILIEQNKLLLVKHRGLGKEGILWAPPGGGMEFGANAKENLQREFFEETGLKVVIKRFLFVHEYLDSPLHSIELFFEVERVGGHLIKGNDPEMEGEDQIIEAVEFLNIETIGRQKPSTLHYILRNKEEISKLLEQSGYFSFEIFT